MSEYSLEAIRQARKKKVLIKVLSVFGDDSSDEQGERIFAIAGIIGTQELWDLIEPKWLSRTGGIPFHATDCEADQGDYKDIAHDKNRELYKDLTQLLAHSGLFGFGVVIDLVAYNTFVPHEYEDSPYMFCFCRVISHFAKKVFEFDKNARVKFTFDTNPKIHYNAGYLYDNFLTNCKDWDFRSVLEDELGFATRKTVGIQVVDLFAKEIMKRVDNEFGPVKRPIRKSFEVLKDTGRFYFDYYVQQWFKQFSKDLPSLQKLYRLEPERITKWLLNHKRSKLRGEDLVNYIIDLDAGKIK